MIDVGRVVDTLTFLATTSTHGNGRKRAELAIRDLDAISETNTSLQSDLEKANQKIAHLRAEIDERDAAISVASRIAKEAIAAQRSVKNVTISSLADEAERLMDSNVDPRPLSQRDRWRLTAQWLRKHLEDR